MTFLGENFLKKSGGPWHVGLGGVGGSKGVYFSKKGNNLRPSDTVMELENVCLFSSLFLQIQFFFFFFFKKLKKVPTD